MCIRDLIDQFEIQGAYCIKMWDEEACDNIVLAEGKEFECDRLDINDDIMKREIAYMYAIDGVLNFDVE